VRDDRVDDVTGEKPIPTPADLAKVRRPAAAPTGSAGTNAGTTQAAAQTEVPGVRAAVQPVQPVPPVPPSPRPRVVIAEDEALIRLDLSETLQELGYDVVGEAGDGERAVALAEELRPDLVILDVKMPVLDGISAARRIAGGRIAPVVILTAFSQRDLVERARDAGAMAYLVKPFSSTDLMPAIEMALSRYAEVTALELEVSNLTERLETRKLVDRAKSVLQESQGLSEPEAFRWIQRAAMDQRVSMRAVAEALLTPPDAHDEP
jgi:two-component system, response regulator PdtaR